MLKFLLGSCYQKCLYFELNHDIKRFQDVRPLLFESMDTPPSIFSRNEEIF